jgi:4-amino-4-deoxy-L-arabinose transferase-like glycosyltransferase
MRTHDVLRQVELAPGRPDARVVRGVLLAILGLYAGSYLIFYPAGVTNHDEVLYVYQARLLLEGSQSVSWVHPLTDAVVTKRPAEYPMGTALLLAVPIALFGERGAWLLPILSVVIAVLATARWIAIEGRAQLYALLVLGYGPTLFVGRLAMSDAPSVAAVGLGMWLFWRGIDRGAGWWFASAFVAGASILVRETNALVFAPFFLGTVLRRERRCLALVLGGLLGVGVRLIVHGLTLGDPFYMRRGGFGLHTVPANMLLHLPALLILVPGGLAFALAYRGRRRPELVAAVLLYVVFFIVHWFGPGGSSFARRLVIELRYYSPLIPLFAFAMAESVPRLWRRLESVPWRPRLERLAAGTLLAGAFGLGVTCVVVNAAYGRWTEAQASMRNDIARHTGAAPLVTDWWATRKFIDEIDRHFLPLDRAEVSPQDVVRIAEKHGHAIIAFLDRSDSAYWREDAKKNAAFMAGLPVKPTLLLDRRVTSTDHLRIWRLDASAAPADRSAPTADTGS